MVKPQIWLACLSLFVSLGFGACTKSDPKKESLKEGAEIPEPLLPPFRAKTQAAAPVLIENVKILTATGTSIEQGYIFLRDGKIAKVGSGSADAKLSEGSTRIDGRGKVLTPGIIDTHSHMGVYPLPAASAHADGNEATRPTTPDVWAEHSFWPQDSSLWRALSSGVTTIQILPGSANLVGGRSATLHLRPATDVASMRFPGAPQGLKMACGENPKRTYGNKSGPSTRMGNVAGFRKIFQDAVNYRRDWENYRKKQKDGDKGEGKAPERDHALDTIVKAMNGEILVHVHCYRSDEMAIMLDLAKIYGFKIRSFHHGLEAYKLRDRLAAEDVSVSTWTDWWGFKMEAFDGVPQNIALLHAAKARAVVHSDSEEDVRHLQLEAVKAREAGRMIGLDASDEEVLQWVTKNPAWALGIDQWVGTIEEGKLADVVLWDAHPFSTYAKPEKVFIMGELLFDRQQARVQISDLEVGLRTYGLADRGNQKIAQPGPGVPDAREAKPLVAPATPLDQSFLIEDVRLETGTGQRLEGASVWVDKGLIKEINPTTVPESLPRLKAGGRTLSPGLIEVQSQLGVLVVEMEDAGQDHEAHDAINPAFRVLDGLDPYSFRMAISRAQGITSAIVKPTGGLIAGQGHAIDLSATAEALTTPVPPVIYGTIRGAENRAQFWLKLREAFEDARLYKAAGGNRSDLAHQLSLSPLHLEALNEVLQGKMPLVLSVQSLADVQAAIRLKKDLTGRGQAIQLVLSDAPEAWLAAKELTAAKIAVILTPSNQMPRSLDALRVRDDQAALLHEAGVDVILSTNDIRAGRLRQEAGRAVSYAMPYQAALSAVTSVPAKVFGFKDRGSIEPGKRADLVLWSKDPFEASSVVLKIWINGKEQSLEDRQVALARRYNQAPEQRAL
jgi:imidazolonepropionase-like amidohydrolase